MEHDRDARLLGLGPHRIEPGVAGRVSRRTARRHQQRRGAGVDRLGGHCLRSVEVGERDVTGGQQPGIDRAELDHPPVMCPGCAVGQVEVGAVLPVVEAAVVKGVEHQLAGEAQEVEGPRPIVGDERAGCGEVLSGHHLGLLIRAVPIGRMPLGQPFERLPKVALLIRRVPGLAQLVAARIAQRLDPAANFRVGVVTEPRRCLHDVRVRVVDHPRVVVRHRPPLPLHSARSTTSV